MNGVSTSLTSTTLGVPPTTFNTTLSTRYWKLASSIGATGTPSYFDFKISDLLVYNKTLSSTEVLQNYNSTKSRFGL